MNSNDKKVRKFVEYIIIVMILCMVYYAYRQNT